MVESDGLENRCALGHRGFESHPLRSNLSRILTQLERKCEKQVKLGEVRERSNRHAWKACVPNGTVGSNPTLSVLFIVLGAVAQLGERQTRKLEVGGSIPLCSIEGDKTKQSGKFSM